MGTSKKRAAIVGLLAAGAVVAVLWWQGGSGAPADGSGFATPALCLDAYRDAVQEGDAAGYLRCLGEPLRGEARGKNPDDRDLGETLRREMRGVKSWVVTDRPEAQGDRASAVVEEVRPSGVRNVRFRLERTGAGWLIVGIDRGDERAAGIRYGTPVGTEVEGKP